ncbi:hypothetical protein [Micrococcus luteus]|uniref:hypothetical protein n=1 Tax=Micrococcus luteus TaxID=1270 RepID=UPI000B3580D1|nr:hypothetical protein [Micrococcus luteus]
MEIYSRDEVFGVSRTLPRNYVVRSKVDGELLDALQADQHIVVHGSSKQGKTSLRKKNLKPEDYIVITCINKWTLAQLNSAILKAAGFTIESSTTRAVSGEMKILARIEATVKGVISNLKGSGETSYTHGTKTETRYESMEVDPSDVNDIVDCLDEIDSPKLIVLEDFHYLPPETQVDFAIALKAFHEDSDYLFMVVGVWKDDNRLILLNGDLSGRVVSINADAWTNEELSSAIRDGQDLLNIKFEDTFISDLVSRSFESIYIVQECCRQACKDAGVDETLDACRTVRGNPQELVQRAVDLHSARYLSFISDFAGGHQSTTLEMHKYILGIVLMSEISDLESGMRYTDIRKKIDAIHPESPINQGNITQALRSTGSLQGSRLNIKPIILDYDESTKRLNIVDRSFLIWLANQDRSSLLEHAGIQEDA